MAIIDRTFPLSVEGIGDFVFRKRRMPDQIKIEADARRMTDGPIDDVDLHQVCISYQTLKHLTVEAPADWDLENLDPLDPEDVNKMWKVWGALREQEEKFRKGA